MPCTRFHVVEEAAGPHKFRRQDCEAERDDDNCGAGKDDHCGANGNYGEAGDKDDEPPRLTQGTSRHLPTAPDRCHAAADPSARRTAGKRAG